MNSVREHSCASFFNLSWNLASVEPRSYAVMHSPLGDFVVGILYQTDHHKYRVPLDDEIAMVIY